MRMLPLAGLRAAAALAIGAALCGCAGTLPTSLSEEAPAPKVPMTGRWLLGAKDAPPCGMVFKAAANGQSGTIAPEGGCPGNFFTSRSWAFVNGGLQMNDHNGDTLAQLRPAGDRFTGESSGGGLSLTLSRPAVAQ
jgi:hypothetical protein